MSSENPEPLITQSKFFRREEIPSCFFPGTYWKELRATSGMAEYRWYLVSEAERIVLNTKGYRDKEGHEELFDMKHRLKSTSYPYAFYFERKKENMGNVYAYCRVSSPDQNEDRQIICMRELQVPEENIFVDKQSGKDFNRPQYKKLLRKLKQNDLIYIKSIDRLGRNYSEILEQWKIITKDKKADLYVIDMPILDTRREKNLLGTFISDLVLTLLSYVAENERAVIRQRQAEGIAAAKARGVHFGRTPNPLPENFYEVYQRWKMKKITVTEAASECEMPVSTFFGKAKKYEISTLLKEE